MIPARERDEAQLLSPPQRSIQAASRFCLVVAGDDRFTSESRFIGERPASAPFRL